MLGQLGCGGQHGALGGNPFGGKLRLDGRKLFEDRHASLARGADLGVERLGVERNQDAAGLHHHPALAAHRAHHAGYGKRQDLFSTGLDQPRNPQAVLQASALHRDHRIALLGRGIGRERGRGVGGGLDRITGGDSHDDRAADDEGCQRGA